MSQQTTGFDGEGQIASAMSYVTNDDMPILYTLTGHNETEIGTNLTNAVEKANLEIQSLNLISGESVPEDAELLIIAARRRIYLRKRRKRSLIIWRMEVIYYCFLILPAMKCPILIQF